MKNAANRLPGKAWRVLSFIPAINWVSLLYIGIINANIISILFAVAYCILTFAVSSIAFWVWLAGVIHYAFVYSSIKKRIAGPTNAPQLPPSSTHQQHQVQVKHGTRGYSDIAIPGTVERRQSIPPRSAPAVGQVQVGLSRYSSQDKFFEDMRQYAAYNGPPAAFVPFMTYWPTYDSMTRQQQAWYFYWRSQVRQGNYLDTDLSYIFLFIYEIISGVGWQTPQAGYQILVQLWSVYKSKFPNLDHYLPGWTFDFAQLNGLEYTAPFESDSVRLYPSVMTDVLVEQHAADVPLKLPFVLIDTLCEYSLVSSKFYKDGNQSLMQEAIPRVVALADAALRQKTQKGILATYGPNRTKKQQRQVYSSAVCPQAYQTITFTVKAYSTNQRLRGYMNELVRYGENSLRALKDCRGRLRGITLDAETAALVDAFLKKEYGRPDPAASAPEKKAEVVLDFGSIDSLRQESDAVREALLVEEPAETIEKSLLTDVKEVAAIYVALSPEFRHLLDRLNQSGWECDTTQEDESAITEINRLAERYLGCALLVKEQGNVLVEDDYRDELEYIHENPPELSQAGANVDLFDVSALSPELKEFVESLLPEQQKVLHALLAFEHPQAELEQIAEESMTMPQILLDDLNAASMQTLGDLLVDFMDQEPYIMDEYVSPLKQSIA